MSNTIEVLDKGFVRLVDSMGDDLSIVQAARVSYGLGTKTEEQDKRLINYLMRHRHTTPFEMVEFKFHVKMPIFVARQWIRHRTASVNEISGRYTEMSDEFHVPYKVRLQSETNKQGSSDEEIDPELEQAIRTIFEEEQNESYRLYLDRLEEGVAREQARINLPLSLYTEMYWKIDLHNLLHFLKLRMDSHAQKEIRDYANAIADLIKPITPWSWEAFDRYVLNAVTFSRDEMSVVRKTISSFSSFLDTFLAESPDLTEREKKEFLDKLALPKE